MIARMKGMSIIVIIIMAVMMIRERKNGIRFLHINKWSLETLRVFIVK